MCRPEWGDGGKSTFGAFRSIFPRAEQAAEHEVLKLEQQTEHLFSSIIFCLSGYCSRRGEEVKEKTEKHRVRAFMHAREEKGKGEIEWTDGELQWISDRGACRDLRYSCM